MRVNSILARNKLIHFQKKLNKKYENNLIPIKMKINFFFKQKR